MTRSSRSETKPRPNALQPKHSYVFDAIGTTWAIDVYQSLSHAVAKRLGEDVQRRIEAFDQNYSRFRDDSLVSAMAAKKGRYMLPPDAKPMVDLYEQLYAITDGAVTPLIGQTLVDAGYDAQYSLRSSTLHKPPLWEDAIKYDFPVLTLADPALLDFGAAGKGYLVDIVGALLHDNGIEAFCIDAGGDILYRTTSETAITVGLEHPGDPTLAIGAATIRNQSICGSAGNRRAWGEYHHIIDPFSLSSPRHIRAAWAVSDSGLLSDGLTTALFFTAPDVLVKHFRFEYAIVNEDYSLEHSPHFPAVFYTGTTSHQEGT